MLEYGLFAGVLGRNKSIIAKSGNPKESSDLKGLTYLDLNSKARAKKELSIWINSIIANQKLDEVNTNICDNLLLTDSDAAKEKINEIYKDAQTNGGELFATHIFPRTKNIDFAIENLKDSSSNSDLNFERILIYDNIDEEIKWVTTHFDKLKKQVNCNLWVIEKYPLQFTRFARTIFPRANIFLYRKDNKYKSIIGLDNIQNQSDKTLMFYSEDEVAFKNAKSYFNSITAFDEIISIKNINEYHSRRFVSKLPKGIHHALNKVLNYGENNRKDIAFIGLFGSLAKLEKGYYSNKIINSQDSDIDLFIVLTGKDDEIQKELVKKELSEILSEQFIVWGDNDKYFYNFRKDRKVTVDIEIRSYQSSFYEYNKLLGYSIFKYFTPLFSSNGKPIREFVDIPIGPLTLNERRNIFINDRKGLIDFRDSFPKNDETDSRRIFNHVINNLAWTEFGHYPASKDLAIDTLKREKKPLNLQSLELEDIRKIINLSKNEAIQNKQVIDKQALDFINKLLVSYDEITKHNKSSRCTTL